MSVIHYFLKILIALLCYYYYYVSDSNQFIQPLYSGLCEMHLNIVAYFITIRTQIIFKSSDMLIKSCLLA